MSETKTKSQPQVDKFRELARELGTDESEKAFDAALKKVAKAKPVSPEDTASKPQPE